MLNWCIPVATRYEKKFKVYCFNWICKCGHTANSHVFFKDFNTSTKHYSLTKCGKCVCNGFKFANNDNCSIECQMRYKLEQIK